MGCDIHIHVERKNSDGVYECIRDMETFEERNYGLFGFLAGVRNYSGVAPISPPRGIPSDASIFTVNDYQLWDLDAHSASWLSVEELNNFDYDQECEDRRVTRQIAPNMWHGGCTCDEGEGRKTNYREFLGDYFFIGLKKLVDAGADRIVFWFDN